LSQTEKDQSIAQEERLHSFKRKKPIWLRPPWGREEKKITSHKGNVTEGGDGPKKNASSGERRKGKKNPVIAAKKKKESFAHREGGRGDSLTRIGKREKGGVQQNAVSRLFLKSHSTGGS